MQRRVRLVDLVTAGETICPDIAELIEMIEAPTGDENEIVDLSGGALGLSAACS